MSVELVVNLLSLAFSAASVIMSANAMTKVDDFEHEADEVFEETGSDLGNHEARLELLEDKTGLPHLAHPGHELNRGELDDDFAIT